MTLTTEVIGNEDILENALHHYVLEKDTNPLYQIRYKQSNIVVI